VTSCGQGTLASPALETHYPGKIFCELRGGFAHLGSKSSAWQPSAILETFENIM
jgi:hypothetical protein